MIFMQEYEKYGNNYMREIFFHICEVGGINIYPAKPTSTHSYCFCWVRCRHCSNYEARGASGNYKARGAKWQGITKLKQRSFVYLPPQINFLRFLGNWKAVEENRKAFEENQKAFAESRKASRKVERRCRKQKAIGESWKAVDETQKAVAETRKAVKENRLTSEEIWIWSKENQILGQENLDFPKTFSRLWQFWGLALTQDLLPGASMNLHDWFRLIAP